MTTSRRLWLIRRVIELPLLLQQREWSQTELKQLYDVDGVTIRRDIKALSEYWPIERYPRGREVFYRLKRGAQASLKRVGQRAKPKTKGKR
jgi:DeoR/GlpR family transcriptional regulator of sugar metabolism